MKKIVRRIAEFLELTTDASLFEINDNEIRKANLMFMRHLSMTAGFIMLVMCAYSFITGSESPPTMTYFMMFVVSAIIFGLTYVAFDVLISYTYPLVYFYVTLLVAFTMVVEVYYIPDKEAAVSIAALTVLPMLILDKQSHMLPYTAGACLVFCIASKVLKVPEISVHDVICAVVGTAMGIMINARIFKSRISNLNSSRILARQVEIDGLTGLPNYKKLMQDLSGEKDSRIAKSLCGLAIIDIDDFMRYNSKYGREAGDRALKKIGSCMLRISDPGELIIYRYGGTSLVAVSLIHDYKGLCRVCQGISSLIRDLDIEFEGSPIGKLTVSCGCVDVVECECDEYETMLSMAREAVDEARRQGGNKYFGYLELKEMKM